MKNPQKDYSRWHHLKSKIENGKWAHFFREREVWWCSLGVNIGVEADGKNNLFERPVLILRKFNQEMLWALPLTSKNKEGNFYHSFPLRDRNQVAILSQLRILSSKRLIRRIGKISPHQFMSLQKSFMNFLIKTDPLRGPRVPNGNSEPNIANFLKESNK